MSELKIGQVARKAQVNIETIRFYERRGLISPVGRTGSGYRLFSEDTIKRIQFIKRAKKLGFTLNEISELLSLRVEPNAKCGDIKEKADVKIKDIENKLETLTRMKKALVKLSVACNYNEPASSCPILEALEGESKL